MTQCGREGEALADCSVKRLLANSQRPTTQTRLSQNAFCVVRLPGANQHKSAYNKTPEAFCCKQLNKSPLSLGEGVGGEAIEVSYAPEAHPFSRAASRKLALYALIWYNFL